MSIQVKKPQSGRTVLDWMEEYWPGSTAKYASSAERAYSRLKDVKDKKFFRKRPPQSGVPGRSG